MKTKICLMILISTLVICGYGYEEIDLPEEVIKDCIEIGEEYDIAPSLLMSLVWQESRGLLTNATQITKEKWFKEGIEHVGTNSPKGNRHDNIEICAYYLRKWYEEEEDTYLVLESWHEGRENAVATHTSTPSYYAKEIEERSRRWSRILDERGYQWKTKIEHQK